MKFFLTFFDSMINRPSNKFFLNFFFLKNSFYFNLKNILFIHFFINLQKSFNLKILKFNYTFYKNLILYFLIINIVIQISIIYIVL
jgi:hypothetical protein